MPTASPGISMLESVGPPKVGTSSSNPDGLSRTPCPPGTPGAAVLSLLGQPVGGQPEVNGSKRQDRVLPRLVGLQPLEGSQHDLGALLAQSQRHWLEVVMGALYTGNTVVDSQGQ
jgi:hypothetical protein